ncbi:hypothetical protein [Frankia sp. R43]|uniref:hypothetical protein n=1 Tax=Frankia sp. R43 TaxID=269536 RepID=UPI0009F9C7EA|nr:hypothetical protein [Frankia sp. R43]
MSREPESAAGASLPPAAAPSTLVTRFSASAPNVARVTADEQPAAPEPAGAGAAGATAGTGSGSGGRIPDAEIAGLAERIYEYLARRLRAELLADRERRGLLADPL